MKNLRLGVNTKVLIGITAIMGSVMLIGFKVFDATNAKSMADEESLQILEYVAMVKQNRINARGLACLAYEHNIENNQDSSNKYSVAVAGLKNDIKELNGDAQAELKSLVAEIPTELKIQKVKKASVEDEEVKTKAQAKEEKLVSDEILPKINAVDEYLQGEETKSQEELAVKRAIADSKKTSLIWWIAFGTLLCSSMALLTALIVVFFVTKPLVKVTNVIDSISKGNLATVIDGNILGTNDEIGDLARAFDRTMVSLKLAMKKNKKQKKEAEAND